jgi:hypothetical protein
MRSSRGRDAVAPLTVVIATTHPGPALATCLARLRPQLADAGAELVLADGSPDQDAVTDDLAAGATVIREPGADVFRLRELGARAATGDVIAFTEDHCVPAEDWCHAILAAHAIRPHTAGVAGATRNGSPHALVDRANFLVTFAHVLPPLRSTTGRRVPPPNNISIKAESLADYDLRPGLLELEIVPHLARVGHLAVDGGIVVEHVQSHGRAGSVVVHFHNGRSTTGLLHRRPARERARRIADSVLLVPRHLASTWREVRRRPGQRRAALPAMPWVVVLLVAHAAGQVAGVLAGPGNSPRALE